MTDTTPLGMDLRATDVCPCGRRHIAPTDAVIVEAGAIRRLPGIVAAYGATRAFLLSDKNTYRAAGERVQALLEDAGISCMSYMLPADAPKPDERTVGCAVMHFDASCDIIIGVGSGVINDTGKLLARLSGRRYIIVATAPSMDGYASATSSMERDGLKVSLPSRAADVILGDLDILCAAPERMLTAGLGDMIAKYISICEWRISHIVTGEYYCEYVAELVRDALRNSVGHAEGLLRRDPEAVKAVFEGLIMSGIAMAYAGVSRPASGVEHYFSHIWDMRGVSLGTKTDLHGIQCAVATRIAAYLYEQLAAVKPNRDAAVAFVEAFDDTAWANTLRNLLGESAETMIALEKTEKKYDPAAHKKRLATILDHWDEILAIVKDEIPRVEKIDEILTAIGCPHSAREIGVGDADLNTVFAATRDIRDKYVLSRLCFDLGITLNCPNR